MAESNNTIITVESVQQLIKERTSLERELESLTKFLTTGEGSTFGLHGSFVDSEGYPSPHLELIIEVKKARNRISCIQYDYKKLMKTIEQNLEILHSQSKSNPIARPPITNNNTTQQSNSNNNTNVNNNNNNNKNNHNNDNDMDITQDSIISTHKEEVKKEVEFVYLDLISPGSPSEKAGLKSGDKIYQFGSVGPIYSLDSSISYLQAIASIVRNSEDKPITIKFYRDNEKMTTILIPKKWNGQGLIGCFIKPM
ncbi:hypothetical protein CYY_004459 [Polysphondylium violaceum]|uniref:Nas2 N-terminal domain-containing protein n=1 Tax=Polysphondylium violaceum TaxID=133409 RepID=A0A8J4V7R7_9MYCE|nr:hypothetical protein CYY_004459 [Polysphondylium violaceum]